MKSVLIRFIEWILKNLIETLTKLRNYSKMELTNILEQEYRL